MAFERSYFESLVMKHFSTTIHLNDRIGEVTIYFMRHKHCIQILTAMLECKCCNCKSSKNISTFLRHKPILPQAPVSSSDKKIQVCPVSSRHDLEDQSMELRSRLSEYRDLVRMTLKYSSYLTFVTL